jgi:hypothetical protein
MSCRAATITELTEGAVGILHEIQECGAHRVNESISAAVRACGAHEQLNHSRGCHCLARRDTIAVLGVSGWTQEGTGEDQAVEVSANHGPLEDPVVVVGADKGAGLANIHGLNC